MIDPFAVDETIISASQNIEGLHGQVTAQDRGLRHISRLSYLSSFYGCFS